MARLIALVAYGFFVGAVVLLLAPRAWQLVVSRTLAVSILGALLGGLFGALLGVHATLVVGVFGSLALLGIWRELARRRGAPA